MKNVRKKKLKKKRRSSPYIKKNPLRTYDERETRFELATSTLARWCSTN